MTFTTSRLLGRAAIIAVMLGAAAAPTQAVGSSIIRGCYKTRSGPARTFGILRILRPHGHCKSSERPLAWNVAGVTGATGAAGVTGATGPQGARGATGSAGASGAKGENGANGGTGGSGATGVAGLGGKSGSTGSTGASGATGPAGATGAAGPQGATGPSGVASVTTRVNDSGIEGEFVAAGGLFTKTESCEAGEVATGGGGISPVAGTTNPLSFVSTVASIPILSSGTATGWSVTFRNDDTESDILAWKVYVNCLRLG